MLVANVNFGSLERSTDTSSRSYAIDSPQEIVRDISRIGGSVSKGASLYVEEVENGIEGCVLMHTEGE